MNCLSCSKYRKKDLYCKFLEMNMIPESLCPEYKSRIGKAIWLKNNRMVKDESI